MGSDGIIDNCTIKCDDPHKNGCQEKIYFHSGPNYTAKTAKNLGWIEYGQNIWACPNCAESLPKE